MRRRFGVAGPAQCCQALFMRHSAPPSPPSSTPSLIDISRPLYSGMPHWPGDPPTVLTPILRMAEGAPVNLGQLSLSLHNGTHIDAPFHYDATGATVDAVPLELGVGPARVIDARGAATLDVSLFDGIDLSRTPRILFRTDAWTDPHAFPTTWPLMERTLPGWLRAHGVVLVGLDVPSVDALGGEGLPLHHACRDAGLLILESLDLQAAAPGVYELIALPLRLCGADGSPVRAVLRPT